MSRFLFALPILLTAGCAATTPYAPVRDVAYQAMGGDPAWQLAIGDDRIVLRVKLREGGGLDDYSEFRAPRTLPRTVSGVRTWQSGDDLPPRITVEARRTPCTDRSGQVFEDQVHVRLSTDELRGHADVRDFTQELNGCGGRLLPREGTR